MSTIHFEDNAAKKSFDVRQLSSKVNFEIEDLGSSHSQQHKTSIMAANLKALNALSIVCGAECVSLLISDCV